MRKEKLKELNLLFDKYRTIQRITVYNSKNFLKINKQEILLNNGKKIIREEVLKGNNSGSAVIIFPLTIDGQVLFSIEPRVFTKRTVGLDFPAGYIENGEKPSDAALRELLEETGYVAKKLIEVGRFYQDQGCSRAYNHYFLGLNCKKISNQNLDKDEYISIFTCSYNECLELLNMGYIEGLNSGYLIEKTKSLIKEMKI